MHILVVGSSLFDAIVSLEDNPHLSVVDRKATFALGDKIPVDIKAFTIGGNAPNVSAALKKLSVQNNLYTYLGTDALSDFVSKQLEKEGINTYIETTDAKTGPLSIIFDFKEDRAIFSHHPECNHGFDESKLSQKPDYVFLTSIGKRWEDAYEKILSYALRENIPVAFSPGSQQMKNINETFIKTVHQSKLLFCNIEEARIINTKLSGNEITDNKELLLNLKNYGFDLLSVTDGGNGAYAVDQNNAVHKIPSLPPDGHEKTGAGDAYAGAFFAAYVQQKDLGECMKWGVLNSIGVMSKIGAHTGQLTIEEMNQKASEVDLKAEVI
ncbi:MAG: carbohydrate kinase family protein [Candidatus Levybacteria bacterium]|nr:carbohydrate kinase family protein [Candidatus Levybacteria bacterium]